MSIGYLKVNIGYHNNMNIQTNDYVYTEIFMTIHNSLSDIKKRMHNFQYPKLLYVYPNYLFQYLYLRSEFLISIIMN